MNQIGTLLTFFIYYLFLLKGCCCCCPSIKWINFINRKLTGNEVISLLKNVIEKTDAPEKTMKKWKNKKNSVYNNVKKTSTKLSCGQIEKKKKDGRT